MDAVRSPEHLGEIVRRQRCAQGLTQASLAARCGVSRKWISELENGHPGAEIGLVLTVLASLGLEADIRERPATRSGAGASSDF